MRPWAAVQKGIRDDVAQLSRNRIYRSPWITKHIVQSVIWPFLLYLYVYYFRYSGLRAHSPSAAFIVGPVTGLLGLVFFGLYFWWKMHVHSWQQQGGSPDQRAMQLPPRPIRGTIVLAICLVVSYLTAFIQGDQNFYWYTITYYDFIDLASYVDIDPRTDMGQSYMDAGQVYFKDGTWLATDDMVAFRHHRLYCAAPIIGQTIWSQNGGSTGALGQPAGGAVSIPESGTVDFWAVGVDCCDEARKTFTCGAASDPRARAGLRLLRDDIRPFFKLAVEQWTARVCPLDENTVKGQRALAPLRCLPSKHPLFFHWVVDPMAEVDRFYHEALHTFAMHAFMFFISLCLLTLISLWVLFSLGVR